MKEFRQPRNEHMATISKEVANFYMRLGNLQNLRLGADAE